MSTDSTIESFATLSDQALEQELTQHAANVNAANYRLLMLIAEFDRRGAWGHEGVRSCAHWLNFHCGIALGAAREKLRVAHALAELPETSAAFARGELSYSKARAITRVATPSNEGCLLSCAQHGSASHVERVVRLYRRQYTGADAVMLGYGKRALEKSGDDDAVSSSDPAEAERQGAAHHHDHRQLQTRWDEHGCLLLNARLTPEQGALVLNAIEIASESLQQDQLSSEGNHDIGSPDHKLEGSSTVRHQDNRRADALVLMAEALLQHANTTSRTADRFQVVVHVDQQVLAQQVPAAVNGEPDCYIEQEAAVPVETARRLCCDSKLVAMLEDGDQVLSVGRRTRAVPSSMRRALRQRDGGCRFPGCTASRFVDAHHVTHWADGGHTNLDNLIELCRHHHRLVHEGGFGVTVVDGEVVFSQPDGRPLESVPRTVSSEKPIDTQDTTPWAWCGDSLDYGIAVRTLHYDTCHARNEASDVSAETFVEPVDICGATTIAQPCVS